jgi:putative ABC transport system permease protein
MPTLLTDLRYAIRLLIKRPGFAIIAITALGIGANTAIFSAVDSVPIRPLSYHAPDLAVVWEDASHQSLPKLPIYLIASIRFLYIAPPRMGTELSL